VNAAALPRPARSPRSGKTHPRRRLLVAVSLVLAVMGVLGVRMATRDRSVVTAPASLHFVPVPADPAIEQAWGIKVVALILGADRGILDMRYQVVDLAKSARIHGGATASPDPAASVRSLPTFIRESDGLKILPTSAMMHFEHFHFESEKVGSSYSILYGNSGGLLHVGDKVTVRMADGLELKHVVIAN
jgi:hypothetical protein